MKRIIPIVSALALLACCAAPAIAGYAVTDIGPTPYAPLSINNAGAVAGQFDSYDGFIWTPSNPTQTVFYGGPALPGYGGSQLFALNNSFIAGSFTVGMYTQHAAVWTVPFGTSTTHDIAPTAWAVPTDDCVNSIAYGVNVSGTAVGIVWPLDAPQYAAISYNNGLMTDLNGLVPTVNNLEGKTVSQLSGWNLMAASGINKSGQIVGIGTSPADQDNIHMYLLNSATGDVKDLGSINNDWAGYAGQQPYAINDSGLVVGLDINAQAFSYDSSSATATVVDILTASGGVVTASGPVTTIGSSMALGVNSAGVIVGYYTADPFSGSTDQSEAFVYSDGVATDLNSLAAIPLGWTLFKATGINDSGQIVAVGTDGNGNYEGFLLSPPEATAATPEPISMIFFGTGLVAVSGYIARRKMQRKA